MYIRQYTISYEPISFWCFGGWHLDERLSYIASELMLSVPPSRGSKDIFAKYSTTAYAVRMS